MRELAEASDRVSIEDRGKTFEGRPLVLLTITSPSNHTNLETIKTQHLEATENNASNFNKKVVVPFDSRPSPPRNHV